KMLKWIFALLLMVLGSVSCGDEDPTPPQRDVVGQKVDYREQLDLKKDRAKYQPGEEVHFSISELRPNTLVRYKSLGKTIGEESLRSTKWTWDPPAEDFRGYMVELLDRGDGTETILGTVAVDVSSDWTKFPRYGFLSDFGPMSDSRQAMVLDRLKDFHLNGIQYYDWHAKHHMPLPLDSEGNPKDQWVDLFGGEVSLETVKGYIEGARERGMASMFYNLLYGAWQPEEGDGFSQDWLVFNDRFHSQVNHHDLGDFGKLLVTDPGNVQWQEYIMDRTDEVYEHLDFDGWHLDQLGDRGAVYDFGGQRLDMRGASTEFMDSLLDRYPNTKRALTAVDQYDQGETLSTGVDFAYTEVWSRMQYADLAAVIREIREFAGRPMNTVLAAYMNYGAAEGSFNTPSVLLADAVIFAHGGAHMELGEHMLSSEYFPDNSLSMDPELMRSLKEYYDFMVAYQNLLRIPGETIRPALSSKDLDMVHWPPVHGTVAVLGTEKEQRQIFQLLNFNGPTSLNWRDESRTQTQPLVYSGFEMSLESKIPVGKVWFASPDFNGGASMPLDFEQSQGKVSFTVPYLHYWSMIVIEP